MRVIVVMRDDEASVVAEAADESAKTPAKAAADTTTTRDPSRMPHNLAWDPLRTPMPPRCLRSPTFFSSPLSASAPHRRYQEGIASAHEVKLANLAKTWCPASTTTLGRRRFVRRQRRSGRGLNTVPSLSIADPAAAPAASELRHSSDVRAAHLQVSKPGGVRT